ncbi:PPOX class F420-dependent oxidoreductase [Streptomyces sp. NPDC005438]|uniref:PPOX class F420-dependent oxidoreductase n=1 Tax=Streptomyces sp. NPDC005438 TaxID=3156880 RepID=UPI0033A3D061
MTEQQWRVFALEGTRTGKVATTRRDGRPHLTPIWFLLDEVEGRAPEVVFTTWHESVKFRTLRREPRFSLCVDDQAPPFSYVVLECVARLVDDQDELAHWATRIAGRYMGPRLAESYGARNSVPGEWLVRGRVEKVMAVSGVADEG